MGCGKLRSIKEIDGQFAETEQERNIRLRRKRLEKMSLESTSKNCYYECERGWDKMIDEYVDMMRRVDPQVEFLQIKEKFGGLRIYFSAGNPDNADILNVIVEHAERESERTCEVCGFKDLGYGPKRVELRNGDWIKTLCTEHAVERGCNVSKEEKEKYEKSLRESSDKTQTSTDT